MDLKEAEYCYRHEVRQGEALRWALDELAALRLENDAALELVGAHSITIARLRRELAQLRAEYESTNRFISQAAEDHIDLCRQLGTHHPIINTGCFGTAECVNCFRIGFLVIRQRTQMRETLERTLAWMRSWKPGETKTMTGNDIAIMIEKALKGAT